MKTVKAVAYGVRPIGSGVIKLLSKKSWVNIVGANDSHGQKVGKDVGKVAGLEHRIGVPVSRAAQNP